MMLTPTQLEDRRQSAGIIHGVSHIFRPPPKRTAAEWADANRIIPAGQPEPGRWRTARVPYTRDIYRAFTDPKVKVVVVIMGSQCSKTETVINVFGHRFDDGPRVPAMYIAPTEKNARSMSRDRFMRMIRSTPALWDRLEKGQANKVTEKWIAGIRLGFAWAGSATELASHPAGLIVMDEVDRMGEDVQSEGDPVALARARGSNYWNFVMGLFSTPTIEGASQIVKHYENSTMMKWAWPCMHCDQHFVPSLALLKYASTEDYEELRASAVVVCPECGATHQNKHKLWLNEHGTYLPHAVGPDGVHVRIDEAKPNSTVGFWVNGLCSPWKSFEDRAEEIAKAYRTRDPKTIQGVINTAFGELFKVQGQAPPWGAVFETRTALDRGFIPPWAKLVTMGADVQKNGVYYVVRAWGFNSRSHLVDNGFLHGDTEFDDVWIMWLELLNQGIDSKPAIQVAFVDSGYKPGADSFRRPEHKVYEVCRRARGRAFPTKGHDTLERPIRASQIDVTISGRIIKGGMTLWHIDTDHIKSWVHAQIEPPEGGERLWTTHRDIDEDYCRQMVAEELVVKPSGKRIWVRGSKANHYFDCEVLARAAAMSRQVHQLAREAPAVTASGDHSPAAATPPQAPKFVKQSAPGQSFFQKYRR